MRRSIAWLPVVLIACGLALVPAVSRAETVLNVGTGGAFTSIDPHY